MTALVQRDVRTFPNNSAIAPYLRVKLTGGFLAVAAAADNELGILEQRTLATDTVGTVRLPTTDSTVRATAGGAIAAMATIYRAAGGKVSTTVVGNAWGIALEAASGDGSQIECLRVIGAA
jgi:hypothetical protein